MDISEFQQHVFELAYGSVDGREMQGEGGCAMFQYGTGYA